MNETIIDLIMAGYDLHTNTLRTTSGLMHPDSKDLVEIILMKRLPGMQRKGGQAYAKAKVSWRILRSEADLKQVLKDLQGKVDATNLIKRGRVHG